MNKLYQDKIRGMFLGIGIGDAIGMPVETWTPEKIQETYGRVESYKVPDGHKWFNGEKAGSVTDDTQLSAAVAEALLEGGLDLDVQAKFHVTAFEQTTKGWGNSTRESVRRLKNGANAKTAATGTGLGNGTAMKIAPVAAYGYLTKQPCIDFVTQLSLMTHNTSSASMAAMAVFAGVYGCLTESADDPIESDAFIYNVACGAQMGDVSETIDSLNGSDKPEDNLADRLHLLENIEEFEKLNLKGACYCCDSIPFTLYHWLKKPNLEGFFDLINAGGDTDSNGSMFGAMLGAKHGTSIWPEELIDGLICSDYLIGLADRLAKVK